ncbi:MAG: hypothetical protein Kow0029_28520 [Candidatus Rifleibacteriota bacterium]
MAKNNLQKQRVRDIFINSASEILREHGLKGISARNVAEHAGYSYATLYNYFKDIKDLVFECIKIFRQECLDFVRNDHHSAHPGPEMIKAVSRSYAKYFLQYPGIFELFFIEKNPELQRINASIEMVNRLFFELTENHWEYMISRRMITQEGSKILLTQINATLIGMLLLYLNRQNPQSFSEFVSNLDNYLQAAFACHNLPEIGE